MMEVGVAGRPGGQTVGTGAVGAKRRVSSICSNTLLLLDTISSLLRERLSPFSLLSSCVVHSMLGVFFPGCVVRVQLLFTMYVCVCESMCVTS